MTRAPKTSTTIWNALIWIAIVVQLVLLVLVWSRVFDVAPAAANSPSVSLNTVNTGNLRLRRDEIPVGTPPPSPSITLLVVLGNMPLNDATPTIDTMTRVRTAVEYYKKAEKGMKCLLAFSGGPTAGLVSEAATMSNYAQSLGVQAEDIILEEKARSTGENAVLTAQLLLTLDIHPSRIFIVSKNDHLDWAMDLFRRKAVPGNYFQKAERLGCEVDVRDSIRQMEEFLILHPQNLMAKKRLKDLRNGIRGID